MTPDNGITSTAATSGEINPQKQHCEEDTQEACSNASIGEDTDEEELGKKVYACFLKQQSGMEVKLLIAASQVSMIIPQHFIHF
ncbi:hypothetical protein CROQUDRAFT_652834 [Cronartium quercuum f. sp. fusiforme G11]|uniref:Uncharacterized protein n=1 Tax=Cronartium quercuum f. sp. fusiforme G11 TaxID=708437 RepID=A0A9P6TF04_9BASI|nr:hypothetical protein CROQUDRAFT_652834 [Cronartium quercuum f. sp. fusiforme G11]